MKINETISRVQISYSWSTNSKTEHEIEANIHKIIVSHFFIDIDDWNKRDGMIVSGFTEFTWNRITY